MRNQPSIIARCIAKSVGISLGLLLAFAAIAVSAQPDGPRILPVIHVKDDHGRPVPTINPKAERRAAEWAFSTGGHVIIEDATGRKAVKASTDLTKEDFVVRAIHLPALRVTDDSLKNLVGLSGLTHLNLGSTKVTDAGLEHLKELSTLTWLSLSGTKVDGPGLAHLAKLTRLAYLDLGNLPMKDADLQRLPPLPELRELDIASTKITDAGMKYIKDRTELLTLSLERTAITDAGLDQLVALKELRTLFIGNTKVTDEGIARLKRSATALDARR